MQSRLDRATELHKKGYNCAQSVLCNYADLLGLDESQAFKIAEGFGGGMGMQSVCGALTGLFMLAGLNNSSGTSDNITKASTIKTVKELSEKFAKKNGSVYCKDLKGLSTGKVLRSCDDCIKDACELFEEYITANQKTLV